MSSCYGLQMASVRQLSYAGIKQVQHMCLWFWIMKGFVSLRLHDFHDATSLMCNLRGFILTVGVASGTGE